MKKETSSHCALPCYAYETEFEKVPFFIGRDSSVKRSILSSARSTYVCAAPAHETERAHLQLRLDRKLHIAPHIFKFKLDHTSLPLPRIPFKKLHTPTKNQFQDCVQSSVQDRKLHIAPHICKLKLDHKAYQPKVGFR